MINNDRLYDFIGGSIAPYDRERTPLIIDRVVY